MKTTATPQAGALDHREIPRPTNTVGPRNDKPGGTQCGCGYPSPRRAGSIGWGWLSSRAQRGISQRDSLRQRRNLRYPSVAPALAGSLFNTTDEYGRATAISRQPQIQFRAGFGYNLRRTYTGAEA